MGRDRRPYRITIDKLWSMWQNDRAELSDSTRALDSTGLAIARRLGVSYADEITHSAVRADGGARLRGTQEVGGRSPRTINLERSALKRMLAWAVDQELLDKNPLKNLKQLRDPGDWQFRRALTLAEVHQLLDWCSSHGRARFADLWRAFVLTGMRSSELRHCQCDWLDGRVIHLPANATKCRLARDVYLGPQLAQMLASMPGLAQTVFVNRRGRAYGPGILDTLKSHVRVAGIEPRGICIHSLRYTTQTIAIDAGIPEQTVDRLLGHVSGSIGYRRYYRPDESRMIEAAAQLEGIVWKETDR
jgi:integrase